MTRHVVLVCGPPCAGKTTYVREHAKPDDYILDHDDLARMAGSPARWGHAKKYRALAEAAMWDGIDYIADSDDITAWVIRAAPGAHQRQELAAYLRADDVVVLNPPIETLYARADERGSYGTRQSINYWLSQASDCT